MTQVLDSIVKYTILDGPQTINVSTSTSAVDISVVENAFAVQVDYSGGVSLDVDMSLEVSVDGNTYVNVTESISNHTDATGSQLWDITEMGVNFARVLFTVNSGSLDVDQVILSGKRRH